MDEKYMRLALKQAEKAYKLGEVPVGAVIVKNGIVLSKAYNKKEILKNLLKHAEMIAIEKACKKTKDWRLDDCIMYTTLFPCPMCASAIQQARIKKVVYINNTNSEYIFNNSISILTSKNSNHKVELYNLQLKTSLLNNFFENMRKKS